MTTLDFNQRKREINQLIKLLKQDWLAKYELRLGQYLHSLLKRDSDLFYEEDTFFIKQIQYELKNPLTDLELVQKDVDELSDKGKLSDGYHTFNELYEHRCVLTVGLVNIWNNADYYWLKALKHHDGSSYDGWFLLGICHENEMLGSYHLPMSYWNSCRCKQEEVSPFPFNGHTPEDTLRLISILTKF